MDRTWPRGRSPRSEPLASVRGPPGGASDDGGSSRRREATAPPLVAPPAGPLGGRAARMATSFAAWSWWRTGDRTKAGEDCSCAATLDELRRAGDDRIDAATGV